MSNHNRRRRKNNFICVDCRGDTSEMKEHYFVHTNLWTGAGLSILQMCCISCLERRLGRPLRRTDFTDASINNPKHNSMSTNLLNALRRN